ncbi:MAG TPA: hypothetical protein VLI05_05575 [Candidatus Saccharimonadia bacterium]|nr:hypothetical protein [Candidatus Saccharimonadia bacterium]
MIHQFATRFSLLNYYIYATLGLHERNAYDLCQRIATDSVGQVTPTTATMHHALKGLMAAGTIEPAPSDNGQVPQYRLTTTGQRRLQTETKQLERALLLGRLAQTGRAV